MFKPRGIANVPPVEDSILPSLFFLEKISISYPPLFLSDARAGNEEHLQVPREEHGVACDRHSVCPEVGVRFKGT
jgi:hypothetical protein